MPEAASYDMLDNTPLYVHTETRRDRPVDRNQGEAKVGHLLLPDTTYTARETGRDEE